MLEQYQFLVIPPNKTFVGFKSDNFFILDLNLQKAAKVVLNGKKRKSNIKVQASSDSRQAKLAELFSLKVVNLY